MIPDKSVLAMYLTDINLVIGVTWTVEHSRLPTPLGYEIYSVDYWLV